MQDQSTCKQQNDIGVAPARLMTSLAAASKALPSTIAPAGPSEAAPCCTAVPFPLPCLSPLCFPLRSPLPLFALVPFPESPSSELFRTLPCPSSAPFGTCPPTLLTPLGCKPSWLVLFCPSDTADGAARLLKLQACLHDYMFKWFSAYIRLAIVWDVLQCCSYAVSVMGTAEEGVARERKTGRTAQAA